MKKIIRSSFYLTLLLLLLCVDSGCTKAARESRAIAKADSDFKAGRYARAEIEYIQALRIGRRDLASEADVYSKLGRVYFAQGRWAEAVRYLNAGKTNDVPSKAMVGESFFLMGFGYWPRAFEESAAVLRMQPGHSNAMVLLTDSAGTEVDKLNSAESILDSQPEVAKKTAAYLTAKGTLRLRSTNLDAAEKQYQDALKLDRKFYRAHLGMAYVYALRNDKERAKAEARSAIAALPSRSGAISGCLQISYILGDTTNAVAVATDLSRENPDFVPPYLFLADVAFEEAKALEQGNAQKKARFEDSLSFFKKAQVNDPQNLGITAMCGDVYLAMNDGTNALSCFEAVARSQTNPPPALLMKLGYAHVGTSDLTGAKALFRQALDSDTNAINPEAALVLAELVVKLKDLPVARNLTPKLIKLTTAQSTNQPSWLRGAYIQLANLYLTQSDVDNAIKTMEVAQRQFTNDAQFPYLLGQIYTRVEKKTEARNAFEQALKLAPDNLMFLQALTMHYLNNSKYEDAYNLISNSITNRPALATLHYLQGVVFQEGIKMSERPAEAEERARRIEGAIACFKETINLDPTFAPAYYSLAQVYAVAQRHQEALRELKDLLGKTNSPSVHLLAAEIHLQLKNYSEAAAAYEKILAINQPQGITLTALNNLACLYTDHTTNKWDEAYNLAERARELAPRSSTIADTFGWAAFRKGEYSQALTLLNEATEDRELAAKPAVMYHLAMAHYMAGEEEIAREEFNQAINGAEEKTNTVNTGSSAKTASESTPDWMRDAKIKLENLSLDMSAADEELETKLTNRLAAAPGDPVLLRRLGMVQERRGKFDKALESYEAALKFNPKHTGTRLQIALLYAGPMNQLARGLELAEQARRAAPNDPEAVRVVGKLAYRSGDYHTAVIMLKESAPNYPDDHSLRYDLGAAYYCDGRGDEAEQEMRKLKESGAPEPLVADAKQFLSLTAAAKEPGKNSKLVEFVRTTMANATNNLPAMMLVAADYGARKEDYQKALDQYTRILKDHPQFLPATRNLGLLYFNAQVPDKAYKLMNKDMVRERYSEDAVFCRALGILACENGDYRRAAQLLQSNPGGSPNDPEALFYLGKAQFNSSKKPDARNTLQLAINSGLREPLKQEARKMLEDSK